MTPADVLEQAADLIENVGWVQGTDMMVNAFREPTRFCAVGACAHVIRHGTSNSVVNQSALYMASTKALSVTLGGSGTASVARWNDAPEQTREGVVEGLRQAAKDLRNAPPLQKPRFIL